MQLLRVIVLSIAGLVLLIIAGLAPSFSATNLVEISSLALITRPVTPDELKPAECAPVTLTRLIVVQAGDVINDKQGGALIIGSPLGDTIMSRGAPSCIIGGAGDDLINARRGGGVLLGGPGNDTLTGGDGDDWLYGGPGDDNLDGRGGTNLLDGGSNLPPAPADNDSCDSKGGTNTIINCEQ